MRVRVALTVATVTLLTCVPGLVRAVDGGCMEWCAQAEAQCSLSVRESRRSCAQKAATGGVNPVTRQRDEAAYPCGWFRGNHCDGRWAGAGCANRQRARLDLCLDAYAPDTAAEYLACGDGERKALALCRDELSDCQAQCR